jgi:hypothetical protein
MTYTLEITGKLLADIELKGYNIKVPYKYLQEITTKTPESGIPIFNIAKSGFLVSVIDYIELTDIICVSQEVFHLIKHLRRVNDLSITIQHFTDYEQGTQVLLEPLNTYFLDVSNQTTLLQDYICKHIRLLYPHQEFTVYDNENKQDIKFRVIETNKTRFKVILAIDTDLVVDFNCKKIIERMKLPEPFRNPIPMYIPSDGMRCIDDYIEAGLYSGKELIKSIVSNNEEDYEDIECSISSDNEVDLE